jgi:excisionase family DNA binding protein
VTAPAAVPSPDFPSRGTGAATNGASQLLTAEQLAERWQVPKSHVYRLAREGRLPVVELGRYRRFRLAAIEEFESSGGCSG